MVTNSYVVKNKYSISGKCARVIVLANSEERALELASKKFSEESEVFDFWNPACLEVELIMEGVLEESEEYVSSVRY